MENQQNLSDYIARQLHAGQTPDEIARQLAGAGWSAEQIHRAFTEVQTRILPAHMQTAPGVEQNRGDKESVGRTPANDSASLTHTATTKSTAQPQANGRRRGRIKTGWILLTQSLEILKGNPYLFRYFFMTWAMVLAVNAAIVGVLILAQPDYFDSSGHWYSLLFVSYLIIFTIINLYAAGLARNIFDIYAGRRRPYRVYMQAARHRFGPILAYSLIAAVIGVILDYVIEKLGRLGQIISWLLGIAWSLSTMFVLPIIMDERNDKVSAPAAIKQSLRLLKGTWGEGLVAKATVNTPLAIIQFVLAMACGALIFAAAQSVSLTFLIWALVIYLFVMISIAVIGSYANSLVNVALYFFATTGEVPPGFSADMLNNVLIKRRSLRKAPGTSGGFADR